MRIALISDIHGNFVALEAVLAEIDRQQADAIICLGDLTLSGPQPREVVARIRALGCPVVRGNCDDVAAKLQSGRDDEPSASPFARWVGEIDRWSSYQLTREDADYLRSLPMTYYHPLDDANTLCCFHGSPLSNTRWLAPSVTDEVLAEALAPGEARVMAGGHTHMPMVREVAGMTMVNPGTVGLPVVRDAETGAFTNPTDYAQYAILTWQDGRPEVDLRTVPLDEDAVWAAARASGMPHVDRWRGDWNTE